MTVARQHDLIFDRNDEGSIYTVVTEDSSSRTESNRPGPGRNLGNLYSYLGSHIEDILSAVAARMGRGPRKTATIMRIVVREDACGKPSCERKLKSLGKRLVKYTRSNVESTQEAALGEITELTFEDERFRQLLKTDSDGIRSIGLLKHNANVWHNMPKPIQSQAERALIALADDSASIKVLVHSLGALPVQAWPQMKYKLEACLRHKGYSFITVRYLRRVEIRDAFLLSEVVLLLMTCLRDLPCLPDATDSIEWPECDELLMTRTSASVQRNARSVFSTLSHNSTLLPKTFGSFIQNLVDGSNSEDMDIVILSCSTLSLLEKSVNIDSPEGAFGVICRNARIQSKEDIDAVIKSCRSLAEFIHCEQEPIQQIAMRSSRIALCVNRCIRREMITYLSTSPSGRMLISETETLFRPSDCPGRENVGKVCKRHGDFHIDYYRRHCDANGNLVHIDDVFVSCQGECGATTVHIMEVDLCDVVRIEVPRGVPFAISDHHPLIAGRLPDGRLSYIFLFVKEDGLVYEGSGPTPEEAHALQSSDGSLPVITPSDAAKVYVRVLRYNPDSYVHCEYYASKMRSEDVGMEPPGPFSWKLQDYLPAF